MKNILILLTLIFLVGCQPKQLEHTFLTPEIVCDSIYTSLPGEMVVCENYLAWTDPFTVDHYLHVVDLNTGKEIGKMGKIGQGPKEFTTPSLSCVARERCFRISDINSSREALFSIDSLLQGKDYYIKIPEAEGYKGTELEEGLYFKNAPDSIPYYFELTKGDSSVYFGNYPIEGAQFHLTGSISYNPENGYLAFGTSTIPYIALYKKRGNTFELLHERKKVPDYRVVDDNLYLEGREKAGSFNIILLKDYIVSHERDYTTDKTNEREVGRDFTKCPQTLFLYDYNLNLKKIVDIRMPIIRITGTPKDNTVYAMVVNPEFALVKCDVGD